MAIKQISARIKGDDYQARYFWYMASQLLFQSTNVEYVTLECEEATHVDDIAIYYKKPGKLENLERVEVEYFQVKYHVDQRDGYSANNIVEPAFINSKDKSLLQRFYYAFTSLKDNYSGFTLNLVSNWQWSGDDKLAKSIRDDGFLPEEFFSASTKTDFGKIKSQWIAHLQIDADTFKTFAKSLRFSLNFFGSRQFNEILSDRLSRVGLKPIDDFQLFSPCDDLYRGFIKNGKSTFDVSTLQRFCREAQLFTNRTIAERNRTIGIRSFLRFAENIELETDAFICVAEHFNGRYPKFSSSWMNAACAIKDFLESQNSKIGKTDHMILLDCHTSFAFLAGYLLTHRANVYPVGPRSGIEICKPSKKSYSTDAPQWKMYREIFDENESNLAVVMSVANQADKQVKEYLNSNHLSVGNYLILEPISGTGSMIIVDSDQAWLMACEFVQIVRQFQTNKSSTFLFISAPNFLTFFLGQNSHALNGITQLFEYDFDNCEGGTYRESITFPLSKYYSK